MAIKSIDLWEEIKNLITVIGVLKTKHLTCMSRKNKQFRGNLGQTKT